MRHQYSRLCKVEDYKLIVIPRERIRFELVCCLRNNQRDNQVREQILFLQGKEHRQSHRPYLKPHLSQVRHPILLSRNPSNNNNCNPSNQTSQPPPNQPSNPLNPRSSNPRNQSSSLNLNNPPLFLLNPNQPSKSPPQQAQIPSPVLNPLSNPLG